jgi:cytochrome c oxidase subunit 2
MRRDYVSVGILWFILTFVGELLVPVMNIFPFLASEEGTVIDDAFHYLMIMSVPVFAFVLSVLIYSLFRFRVSEMPSGVRGETREDGTPIQGSTVVYTAWLLITGGLALAILIHPGVTGLAELRANPSADLVVQVSAEQWNWTYTYPAYGITIKKAKELVLPVDTRVKVEMTANDVLHSFWVPAFRMKIDAVPGKTTVMYVTPNVAGSFEDDPTMRVQCAEMCGTGHARMRTGVVVLEQAEFEKWVAEAVAQAKATTE